MSAVHFLLFGCPKCAKKRVIFYAQQYEVDANTFYIDKIKKEKGEKSKETFNYSYKMEFPQADTSSISGARLKNDHKAFNLFAIIFLLKYHIQPNILSQININN